MLTVYRDLYLGFLIVWWLAAVTSKRTKRRQSIASRFLQGVLIAGGMLLILQVWRPGPQLPPILPDLMSLRIAGLAITLAGFAFAFWARFTLGRNWSGTVTIKHDHELIRHGPYRLVRHPIYTGILLAAAGTATGIGQISCLAGWVLVFLGVWTKSKTEERFMVEQFGAEYLKYRQEVSALIPGFRK